LQEEIEGHGAVFQQEADVGVTGEGVESGSRLGSEGELLPLVQYVVQH